MMAASTSKQTVVETVVVETRTSDADREKERELMDKSRDMIEYLRKEVKKHARASAVRNGWTCMPTKTHARVLERTHTFR